MSTLVALAALLLVAGVQASMNPCHSIRGDKNQVTCEKVRLPSKLCSACVLKEPQPDGNFVNCKSIYDLDDKNCQKQLKKYAMLNMKCDPVRMNFVNNINQAWAREGLDYFVYSVCEECCDCVPRGAKLSEYKSRKKAGTLLSAVRGNCPAHAVYDICAIWPQLKFVSPSKGGKDEFNKPKVCPLLQSWLNSPASSGWVFAETVSMDPNIKSFLDRFLKVAKCSKKTVWKNCQRLENKQKRLGPDAGPANRMIA